MAAQPVRHRFTATEYHQMADAGIFGEDDRVELLDGEIVEMAPIGTRHAACVKRLNRFFAEHLRGRVLVAVQDPIRLGDTSEPQPDVVLLRPRPDDYASRHPGPADVLLVVVVADTTAAWDRQHKVPLYASAGIPEVWLVDLEAGTVECWGKPEAGGYSEVRRARPGQSVAPNASRTCC